MNFTPGPWAVIPTNARSYVITGDGGAYDVAIVRDIGKHDNAANARLIAAAPELLEALKRATVLLQASVDLIKNNPLIEEMTVIFDGAECDGACLSEDCRIALDEARAAIAKAEGK